MMSKHRADRRRPNALYLPVVVAVAACLVSPIAPASADSGDWESTIVRLGYEGVPDAPVDQLEVPWFAYDETGDLYGVRPWDNEWVTYQEYSVEINGVEYWKVTATATAGHKFVGALPEGWKGDPASPQRFATYVVPMHKG